MSAVLELYYAAVAFVGADDAVVDVVVVIDDHAVG